MMDAPPAITVTAALPYRAPLDVHRLAAAIAEVEAAKLESPPGPAGERGIYQITPDVWRQHSTAPHAWASSSREVCRAETLRVVLRHLDHLRVRLAVNNFPDTPFFAALAYGAGPTATLRRRVSREKFDYAHRVANLYAP